METVCRIPPTAVVPPFETWRVPSSKQRSGSSSETVVRTTVENLS